LTKFSNECRYFKARNFPSKNNIAPAGINGAQRRRKYGASSTYKWVPTKSIPYMFSTKAGTTNANINNSKYLSNIDAVNLGVKDEGDDIDIDVNAVLAP
jgi:hypothetical protein